MFNFRTILIILFFMLVIYFFMVDYSSRQKDNSYITNKKSLLWMLLSFPRGIATCPSS